MSTSVHLVNKANISENAVIEVPVASNNDALAPGHVLVKSKIISLSRNNVTYAALGTMLKWWDAFPVQSNYPAPYNDPATWGIVPSWGYGEVLESNHPALEKGRLLYGFWPTSSAPLDFYLEQDGKFPLLFRERSPHRAAMMTLYGDYVALPADHTVPEDELAWKSASATWGSGYVLSDYAFNHNNPIHPLGIASWSAEQADLRDAVVVALSASSNTSRSTTWNLDQKDKADAPKALLEVTSNISALGEIKNISPHKAITYDNITDPSTIDWIVNEVNPSRVVIFDFGGPTGLPQKFHDAVFAAKNASSASRLTSFLFVGVAARESEVQVEEPHTHSMRSNMSGARDAILAAEGEEKYQGTLDSTWKKWYNSKGMGNQKLTWGKGVPGENGIQEAWLNYFNGKALQNRSALVYHM